MLGGDFFYIIRPMTKHYCTLFDKNFLARGLALYESMNNQVGDYVLWMLCMDDGSYETLKKLNLPRIKPLRVSEVEDDKFLAVKATRTPVEYCWMFSSALPLYILKNNPEIDSVTYLDADMYFYDSPEKIFEEFGDNSIMVIPHRYPEEKKHMEKTSGIYNVGMMTFKNDECALECLNWWKDRVTEWCFNRYEDGKLGDQLYLNDWTTRFKKVFVLENHGANVASWNIDHYKFAKEDGKFVGYLKKTGQKFPLIFYHFHALKLYTGLGGKIRAYPITIYERNIYKDYLRAIQRVYNLLRKEDPAWNYGTVKKLDPFRVLKQNITILFRK